jgi:hypothetical protein
MEALLALAAPPPALADGSGGRVPQRAAVPGNGRVDEIVRMLAQLAVTHDRKIAELADRSTMVWIVKEPEMKDAVLAAQKRWQDGVPKERGTPHPMGCSQRTLIYALLLSEAKKRLDMPAGAPATRAGQAVQALLDLQKEVVEASVFRLKPKHKSPVLDKPWVWIMVVGVGAPPAFREALSALSEFDTKFKGLVVAPQRTEDGFITKELSKWLQQRGGPRRERRVEEEAAEAGGGGGGAGERDADMGDEAARKRRRDARR